MVLTIITGDEVSQSGAGSQALSGPLTSMAAIIMSMDRDIIRYQAACEINGHHVEVLTRSNIKSIYGGVSCGPCDRRENFVIY